MTSRPPGPLWHRPPHRGWVAALADQLNRALGVTVVPRPLDAGKPPDGLYVVDYTVSYPSTHPVLVPLVGGQQPGLVHPDHHPARNRPVWTIARPR